MASNLDRLKAAYVEWDKSRGGNHAVWGSLMANHFKLKHVDETAGAGLGFAKDAVSRSDALNYLTRIFDEWDMVHFTPETYVSEGDTIAMFGKCGFRHKVTKKIAECRTSCLWRFEGDKAVEMTEIFDSAVAVAAATP